MFQSCVKRASSFPLRSTLSTAECLPVFRWCLKRQKLEEGFKHWNPEPRPRGEPCPCIHFRFDLCPVSVAKINVFLSCFFGSISIFANLFCQLTPHLIHKYVVLWPSEVRVPMGSQYPRRKASDSSLQSRRCLGFSRPQVAGAKRLGWRSTLSTGFTLWNALGICFC